MSRKSSFSLSSMLLAIGLFIIVLIITFSYNQGTSETNLTQISVIALIVGLLFESGRLSSSWSKFVDCATFPVLGSLIFFIPFTKEPYNLDSHVYLWSISFIIFFIISTIATHDEKVMPRLSEGVTLMQSIAVIYWVIDLHFYETNSLFVRVLMAIGLIFSLFATFNAFTQLALEELNRLILSLWSSIIMVLFAADYIYRVYKDGQTDAVNSSNAAGYIALQYFVLGVSSIYIAHNFYMLLGLLPGKGRGWSDIADILEQHVKRYSEHQVNIFHSLLCLVFTVTAFYLNYYYKILPRHLAIWLVFVTFPIILLIPDYASRKKKPLTSV